MNSKECRITRREIDESELNQGLGQSSLTHLSSCAPCSEFRDERTRLREMVGDLGPVTAPPDFDVRLRARIAAQRQSSARGFFFQGFSLSTPAIAVAALVLVGAASLIWFGQHNRNQEPTIAAGPGKGSIAPVISQPPVAIIQAGGPEVTSTPEVDSTNATVDLTRPRRDRGPSSRDTVAKVTQPPFTARGPGVQSMDVNVLGAESIKQTERNPGEVSLSAPLRPMVVSMQDDRGMTRKFSLPPVSFGSQRLVDNRFPVSPANTRNW